MKHLTYIDNTDNLRALVRQDLRELGIKVPKGKKSKKFNTKTQDKQDDKIFGNYLSHVSCVHEEDCGYIPRFLVDAAVLIRKNIEQEGLFRKSGAVSRQKELQHQIEQGKGLSEANVFDVTSLIKQFFRMLPEPLFTSTYHDTFIKCFQLGDTEASHQAVLLLCLLLPGEHLCTLRFMMKLLSDIASHSDKNKMDPTNLAVVLAPNMMHINNKSEKMNSSEEKLLQVQTSVVELLIRNAESVGMISDSLHERALLMTEVFGTDDELDVTEETLEESRDCRKKEKKRKRSGSFQGLVSTIAQSITKWRKSTDGKAGNMSQASNMSQTSAYSNLSHASMAHNQSSVVQAAPCLPTDAECMATPVVMRKRKASGEMLPFSAHKKKAILQNLPNQATLANTPFTPASGVKRMDISEMRRTGTLNTPNIAFSSKEQLAFSATPCQAGKNTRKRLNLFSPNNTRKGKKLPSGSNISISAANKKGKCKGLFRRLSGGKGDKLPERPRSTQGRQVGQRLAIPPGKKPSKQDTTSHTNNTKPSDTTHGQSPIRAIVDQSVLSPTLPEQSVLSMTEEDTNSLNEGFIDEDGDISSMSANISCVDNSDLLPRSCLSDSAVNDMSQHVSLDEQSSISSKSAHQLQRRGTLRRGRPNSLKAGLLQGEKDNVMKLRRSFGLDKSEIGEPVPLYIPDTSGYVNMIQLGDSSGGSQSDPDKEENSMDISELISEQKSCTSISSEGTGNDNIDKIPVSDSKSPGSDNSSAEDSHTKGSKINSRESMDSLLSGQTDSSPLSPKNEKKNFPRSISTDSGKGSMLEEMGVLENTDNFKNRTNIVVENNKNGENKMNCSEPAVNSALVSKDDIKTTDKKLKRFVSTLDMKTMTASVSRSHSLHVSSVSKKNQNHTPNLQISSETHNLLLRAGYLGNKQKDTSKEDIQVMGPPQNIIKHAEAAIPKHESIMELQTNMTGKVKTCVKSLETDVVDRHASPYRFANSVSRKRGCSPVRIPTIFTKNEKEVAMVKDIVHVNPKLGKGQARLPISTHLLKPTESSTQQQRPASGVSSQLSRKPSIYYTKDQDRPHIKSSVKNVPDITEESMDISDDTAVKNKENSSSDNESDHTPKSQGTSRDSKDDICTPLGEKTELSNSFDLDATPTNATLSKVPGIKLPILPGNLSQRVFLRTSGGHTPRHINRNMSKSPRSPVKPVKRLGSPGSPCRNTPRRHTSPGRQNRVRLTSIPHHLQGDMDSV
ncbi:uncharacterized protein LOC117322904 isoform X2 [Pecten maximus]|uniref:uncharacterized protein LOC117322904 isoform X2 n=1 Tax=Pecten maximus TaxID=6579 RepID=UPI00145848C0|nr:uncharacterized protein LOC117322904 isoform X2 [Pecten maximus]